MATIDPFGFTPTGSFNTLHAYMMCTWMRAQYFGTTGNPSFDNVIAGLIGATSFQVFPHILDGLHIYPRTDVAIVEENRAVVMVRGTSVLPDEIIEEALGSHLTTGPPHPGAVARYFRFVANRRHLNISVSIPPGQVLMAGHSLGGAIAGLLGDYEEGPVKYFTAGGPREGNSAYALAKPATSKLRLVAQGDIVPLVPFSGSGVADLTGVNVPVFFASQSYRHWGIKHELGADGSLTLPFSTDFAMTTEAVLLVARAVNAGADIHQAGTYCFRLRLAIPVTFPALKADPDFPGIIELDGLNAAMNGRDTPDLPWDDINLTTRSNPKDNPGIQWTRRESPRREPIVLERPPLIDDGPFVCE